MIIWRSKKEKIAWKIFELFTQEEQKIIPEFQELFLAVYSNKKLSRSYRYSVIVAERELKKLRKRCCKNENWKELFDDQIIEIFDCLFRDKLSRKEKIDIILRVFPSIYSISLWIAPLLLMFLQK